MDGDAAARLRIALELHELGVEMQRQRLRRERPQLTEAELDRAVRDWLHERPGAEHGDTWGRPSERLR
jgi:Xaa-Pro aminopeptidase